MLTTYDRLMRQYRIERELRARVKDTRDPAEVRTWTRDRSQDRKPTRQAVKDSCRGMGGM